MNDTHIKKSRRTIGRRMINGKTAYPSRDYFGEALRILDNDNTLQPQREHLVALWGVVVGLTRKLTQAVVECQDDRFRVHRARKTGRKTED